MVAIALPQPRQLRLLDVPAPVVTDAQVRRLVWYLRRLAFRDALLAGSFRLERQQFTHISALEPDDAPDGTLVTTSYVEYMLYVSGRVSGVVEVRTHRRDALLWRLATVLLRAGWQVDRTRLVEDGALTSSDSRICERARRLLKGGI